MHLQGIVKSLKSLFLLSALLLLLIFNASNIFADFYVIAGSRGVGTKINALPYTIASPGFYFIAKDLSCLAGSHGITITADNVTLDLMGFSLIGPGTSGTDSGIYMDGRANVEIRNGTVRDFVGSGIFENGYTSTGHRIINIRAKDNQSRGIRLAGRSNLVQNCTVVSNGSNGIYARYGSTVTGNTCYDNGNDGIRASDACTVTGNTCYDNGNNGIYAGYGSTVTGNTCNNNTGYGMFLHGYNLVDQNTGTSNSTNMNACSTCTFGNNVGELTP